MECVAHLSGIRTIEVYRLSLWLYDGDIQGSLLHRAESALSRLTNTPASATSRSPDQLINNNIDAKRSRIFIEDPAQVDTTKRFTGNTQGMSVLELT